MKLNKRLKKIGIIALTAIMLFATLPFDTLFAAYAPEIDGDNVVNELEGSIETNYEEIFLHNYAEEPQTPTPTEVPQTAAPAPESESQSDVGVMPTTIVTVTFNPSGGTTLLGHGTRDVTAGQSLGTLPTDPQRGGFEFVGWRMANGDPFTAMTVVEGAMTVYAQWAVEIIFDGGPTLLVPEGQSINQAGLTCPADPTLEHHNFGGWFDTWVEIGGTGGEEFDCDTPMEAGKRLFPRWEATYEICTITFALSRDANWGTGAAANNTRQFVVLESGQVLTLAQSNAAPFGLNRVTPGDPGSPLIPHGNGAPNTSSNQPRGMVAEGWWTQPEGLGTRAGNASQDGGNAINVATLYDNYGCDVTLYANFTYRIYFNENPQPTTVNDVRIGMTTRHMNIRYDAVGGTLDSHRTNMAQTPLPVDPTRPGMVFMGWYDIPIIEFPDAPFTGMAIPFDENTSVTRSQVVHARWMVVDDITLTFDADGGAFPGGATADTIRMNRGGNLDSSPETTFRPLQDFPTREGYRFMGWYTEPNGGGAPWRFNQNNYEDTTLYARWVPSIEVRLWPNRNSPSSPVGETPNLGNIPIGYSFGQVRQLAIRSRGIFGAPAGTTLSRFTGRPGFLSIAQPGTQVGGSHFGVHTGRGNSGIISGVFNTSPDGRGTPVFLGTQITPDMAVDGVVNLYAVWTTDVVFHNNQTSVNPNLTNTTAGIRAVVAGTSFDENLAVQHNIGTAIATSWIPGPSVSFNHVEFVGWNTAADGSGDFITSADHIYGPTTLYAIWHSGIIFDFGAAPFADIREDLILGDTIPFPTVPDWPGHTFLRWSVNPDGTGVSYVPGMNFTQARRLYAIWSATITFDGNGGTLVGNTSVVMDTGSSLGGAMTGTPTRTNWRFDGFNTEQNGSGDPFTSATVVDMSRTVYAQWYGRVMFDLNGGNVDGATTVSHLDIPENNQFGTLPTPQREGYTFVRWADPDGNTVTNETLMDMGDVELTAIWERILLPFNITYEFTGDIPPSATAPSSRSVIEETENQSATSVTPTTVPGLLNGVQGNFVFQGWESEEVSNPDLFTMPAEDVHFIGEWIFTADTFDITYGFEGEYPSGATVPTARLDVVAGTPGLSATELTPDFMKGYRDGVIGTWIFNGWTSDEVNDPFDFMMPNEDVHFIGTWSFNPDSFDVTYEFEGETPEGITAPSSRTVTAGLTNQSATTVTSPIEGYRNGILGTWTFNGWESDEVVDATSFTMPNEDVHFVGSWTFTPGAFVISYEFEGDAPIGVNPPADRTGILAGTEDLSATDLTVTTFPGTHNGVDGTWTFNGWTSEDVSDVDDFIMPNGNVRMVGSWTFEADPEPTEPPTTTPEETTAPVTTVPEETTVPATTDPSEPVTTTPEETTVPTTTDPSEPVTTTPEETTVPTTTVPTTTDPSEPVTTTPEETTAPATTVPIETTDPSEPVTTVPNETNPFVCEGYIIVDVDGDGNVTVTAPPGIGYEVIVGADGRIHVHLPPEADGCDVIINLPDNEWKYEIDPDCDGRIVTVIPPGREEDEERDSSGNRRPGLPQTGTVAGSTLLGGSLLAALGLLVAKKKKEN